MSNFLSKKENLLLVDISSLAYRWFKNPEAMIEGYVNTLYSFASSYDAKTIVACCDYGKSAYRLSILPEYKSNRKKDRTKEEEEQLELFYDCQKEALKAMEEAGIPVLREYGVEADDIIAYVHKHYKDEYSKVVIISADKDFRALIDKDTILFSPMQAREEDLEYLATELSCTPEQYLNALILSGDAVDGIPGMYLVGEPKKESSRSLVYSRLGNSLDEIVSRIEEKKKKGKIDQYILDNVDIIERNKLLIELHDNVLTDAQKNNIDEVFNASRSTEANTISHYA